MSVLKKDSMDTEGVRALWKACRGSDLGVNI
jgi:hypothetical protein